jgi:ketosteroid isomerase-like protein
MTRVLVAVVLLSSGVSSAALAQRPDDFIRPGPAAAREAYFAQVRSEVNEVLARWKNDWERDDARALAGLYTDAANYFPPDSKPVRTRSLIREYFANFLPGASGVEVQMMDFGMSGDLAYCTARVSLVSPAKQGVSVYNDMLVFRRHGSSWQIETHLSQPTYLSP